MESGKQAHGARVVNTDSYNADENTAYLIDYKVASSKVEGTSCRGSIYIRGMKENGWDNFKFILEKENDFNDFDAELIVHAYENAFKPR